MLKDPHQSNLRNGGTLSYDGSFYINYPNQFQTLLMGPRHIFLCYSICHRGDNINYHVASILLGNVRMTFSTIMYVLSLYTMDSKLIFKISFTFEIVM